MWIHMHGNITHEKEGNPSIRDSIDGSSGHAKWDESEKGKDCVILFICIILLAKLVKTEWIGDYCEPRGVG